MPIVTPDTSEQVDLTPMEPGTYRAKITKCGTQKGKEKGTPMIVPTFEVQYKGKERPRDAYVVTEGPGSWNFDQLLRAVHMDALADAYKDPAVSPKPPFDTDSLIGQELNVVVVEQLYQGQKRDAINGYLRA